MIFLFLLKNILQKIYNIWISLLWKKDKGDITYKNSAKFIYPDSIIHDLCHHPNDVFEINKDTEEDDFSMYNIICKEEYV